MASHPRTQAIVDHLERTMGHRFERTELALQAFTHSSAKERDLPCNERLEFLGDSILGHIVSEYLYQMFPDDEEGQLSTMKSIIVSARTLSTIAYELEFDKIIILGRGLDEKKEIPRSILCNCFEAAIAALHLDAGFEKAKAFVLSQVRGKTDQIVKDEHEKNYKSLLQDYAQRNLSVIPVYKVLQETGPDHKKRFQVLVTLSKQDFGPAWGHNKKEAEQRAAKSALLDLGLLQKSRVREADPLSEETVG